MRTRLLVALAAVPLVACSASDPGPAAAPEPRATTTTTATPAPPPPTPYPGRTWDREAQGEWDALDADLAANGSTCVAVVKDGRLAHEAYWNGGARRTQQRIYSITKSLTSLLVGTQVGDGALSLDDRAADHVREWRGGPAAEVTVRSLLSMTSGRRWSEATDRTMIRATRDQGAYAVSLPQARPPGEAWVYDNAAAQALGPVLADVVDGGDVARLAERRLLGPLGMRDTTWGRDAAGGALTYSGATSTCLDLARVGWLVLNQGRWAGWTLVPASYVREATSPSSALNAAYGLLWWTNARGRVVQILRQAGFPTDAPPYEGRLAPGVPADATWALGYGNQYVAVVPSEGVVAVRLGARPATPDRVTFDSFTTGVLDALR